MKYEGWSNYSTWAVNLWLANDEPAYRYWTERAEEILANQDEDNDADQRARDARDELAQEMESEIEDGAPVLPASMFSDLLGYAVGMVNWYEIAGQWIDTAIENAVDA